MQTIKSYYAKDEFLWNDLSGELAQRYARILHCVMGQMGYATSAVFPGLAVDVGCGGGRYTQLLPAYFTQVVGIDFTQHFCKAGNEKFGSRIKFLCGDATCLPLKDESVSFILSVGLTECLSPVQLQAFLSEVKRTLAPGGAFVVRYWQRWGATYLASKLARGPAMLYPEFYFQTPRLMQQICTSLGFSNVRVLGGLLVSRWYGAGRLGGWPQEVRKLVLWLERRCCQHSRFYDTTFILARKQQR